jgi:hypothetical protein
VRDDLRDQVHARAAGGRPAQELHEPLIVASGNPAGLGSSIRLQRQGGNGVCEDPHARIGVRDREHILRRDRANRGTAAAQGERILVLGPRQRPALVAVAAHDVIAAEIGTAPHAGFPLSSCPRGPSERLPLRLG